MQSQNQGTNLLELTQARDSLLERIKIIEKVAKQQRKTSTGFRDTLKELAIQRVVCKAFGFPDYSEFEWNMIVDKERIGKNLREVEVFMFDDPEIQEELNVLKQDLHNDVTILNVSTEENQNFDYPVIKNRYDDVDMESIPFHWQNIDPLLYHLLIWAVLKQSVLEMSDEDSNIEYQTKLLTHKKNCLQFDIEDLKSKLKIVNIEQSRLLDTKVNFQKITEK